MAIKNKKQGIALLVALIFMSVMLSFGLTLASLSYKQSVLTSSAIESQYAFYTADAALECVLYADQQQQAFTYSTHSLANEPNATVCNSVAATITGYTYSGTQLTLSERVALDGGIHCADLTVYKLATGRTYLFAQGYNVPCSIVADPQNTRLASRGINARY